MSANVSNMYERVGNYGGHLDKRTPRCFSALILPSKQELRTLGLTDSASMWGWNRDHPYAKWQTHAFERGTSMQDALGQVEAFNTSNDRITKVRITFTDGTHIHLQRRVPARPDTLKASGTYDPNEVFRARTDSLAATSRTDILNRSKPIVDAKGHLINRRNGHGSSFAPEKLFADCPINDPSKVGFAFTPVGYNSYMVRPNYRIPGCKPTIASYSESAFAYRPRGFGNDEFPNHEEITGRNEVSKPRSERAGEHVYTGSFLRKTQGKGAPLSPSFLRNTASGTLNNTYHNSMQARRAMSQSNQHSDAGVTPYRGVGGARPTTGGPAKGVSPTSPGNNQQRRAASAAPAGRRQQQQHRAADDYSGEADHLGAGGEEEDNVYNYDNDHSRPSSNGSNAKVHLGAGGRVRVRYNEQPEYFEEGHH